MSDEEDDPRVFEGSLPENAVPVQSFAVGYGEVTAVDDDGVHSLPMVTVLTNEGEGPMMLFSLDASVRLVGELTEAIPKSVARFDPKFAATITKADEVIARTQRAQRRSERGFLLGYLTALSLALLLGAVSHSLKTTGELVSYILTLVGATYLLRLLVIEVAEWQNARDRKKRRGE